MEEEGKKKGIEAAGAMRELEELKGIHRYKAWQGFATYLLELRVSARKGGDTVGDAYFTDLLWYVPILTVEEEEKKKKEIELEAALRRELEGLNPLYRNWYHLRMHLLYQGLEARRQGDAAAEAYYTGLLTQRYHLRKVSSSETLKLELETKEENKFPLAETSAAEEKKLEKGEWEELKGMYRRLAEQVAWLDFTMYLLYRWVKAGKKGDDAALAYYTDLLINYV